MSDSKKLESSAALAGIFSRAPEAIVHHSAASLRHLLDEGATPEDPRCRALLQLVNSARLHLLPNSNDGANADDLISRAMHIDISTASMAAIMGLQNTANLTGAAAALASSAPPRPANPPSSSGLKLRLLPKLSQTAIDALFGLIRTDARIGLRPKQTFSRLPVATGRAHKVRSSARQTPVRRRRARSSVMAYQPSASNDVITPVYSHLRTAASSAAAVNPLHDLSLITPVKRSQAPQIAPRRLSVTFAEVANDTPQAKPPIAPTPPLSSMGNPVYPPISAAANIHRERQMMAQSHFRPRQSLTSTQQRNVQSASAREKGTMNDTAGTPDDVIEKTLEPKNPAASSADGQMDTHAQLCSVLAEREYVLKGRIRQRRAELAALPPGVTEQTRRKAIIDSKKLALLDLQNIVRNNVCAEMKKLYSSLAREGAYLPGGNMSLLYRRRDPPIYSYMDGYPRITPSDGIPEMPPRHPQTIARDSMRMAEFDMSRMNALKKQRKQEYFARLQTHIESFKQAVSETRNARCRVVKGLERYFVEKKRAEERRRKMERIERLKLLRSNDEQAYLNLLKNTKNERLLQLVRQTDNYLMQIGAQVEQQRDSGDRGIGSAHDAFAEELGEKGEVPLDAMRRRRDLYYTVTHAVQEDVHQPSIMVHGKLKGYQIEGLKWMVSLYNNNLNGILADEMGLGKTIQTISLITYLIEVKKNPGPFLVIVPLSVMGNWVRELDLWAPSLEKIQYRGDRQTRRQIQRNQLTAGTFNVLLTTYEFTVKDQTALSRVKWQYIIIDEGHRMKNANCKLAMTLGVKYKSRNRLLLTGTPLQNNLTELWALLNFLLPNIFSSSDTFETWFKQPFETKTLGDSAELEEEERLLVINRLHQVLRPFLLRRLKTDVESQLPQKVEHVIHCHMSSWQQVLYDQVRDRIGLATSAHNGSVRSFNNLLMQFKKVCNHPFLFYDSESIEHIPPDYLIRASGKFFLLHHMLPKLKMHGHRTLIFSQMTAALDYLELFLNEMNVGYLRLDGNTKADERQDLLNQFNADDSPYFCFLLSTRAGGLGLNLQTADTVIIFDSDWNPMMDLQAQDRAHRIGQTQVVRVYRLISSGTVEVNILEQANRKLHVDAQIIQAGQFNNKSTEKDRHQMLKTLLRQQNKEGEEDVDVPSMGEVNRMIARSDEELESFEALDERSTEDGSFKPLLTKVEELPEWVLKPNIDHKDEKQRQQELLDSHGRGRRKRKAVLDMDALTEAEWFKIAEGEMTVEEAFEKRSMRKARRLDRSNGRVRRRLLSDEEREDALHEPGDSNALDEVTLGEDSQDDSEENVKYDDTVKNVSDNQDKSGDHSTPVSSVEEMNLSKYVVKRKAIGTKRKSKAVENRADGGEKVLLTLRIKQRDAGEANEVISIDGDGNEQKGEGKVLKFKSGSTSKGHEMRSKKRRRRNGNNEEVNDDDIQPEIRMNGVNGDDVQRSGNTLKIRFMNPTKKQKGAEDENEGPVKGLKIRIPAKFNRNMEAFKMKSSKEFYKGEYSQDQRVENGRAGNRSDEDSLKHEGTERKENNMSVLELPNGTGAVDDGIRRSGRKRRLPSLDQGNTTEEPNGRPHKIRRNGVIKPNIKVLSKGNAKISGTEFEADVYNKTQASIILCLRIRPAKF